MTDNWRNQAACRGADINLFFSERGDHGTLKTATEICNGTNTTPPCPVKQQCLDYANSMADSFYGDNHGVYGGLVPNQRIQLRRKHARIERNNTTIERDPATIGRNTNPARISNRSTLVRQDCARPAARPPLVICSVCDGARWLAPDRGYLMVRCSCGDGLVPGTVTAVR